MAEIEILFGILPRIDRRKEIHLSLSTPESSNNGSAMAWGGFHAQPTHLVQFPRHALPTIARLHLLPKTFRPEISEARTRYTRIHELAHIALELAVHDSSSMYAQAADDLARANYLQTRSKRLESLLWPIRETTKFLPWVDKKAADLMRTQNLTYDQAIAKAVSRYKRAYDTQQKLQNRKFEDLNNPHVMTVWDSLKPYAELWASLAGVILHSVGPTNLRFFSTYPDFFYRTKDGAFLTEVEAENVDEESLEPISIHPTAARKLYYNFKFQQAMDLDGECQTCRPEAWAELSQSEKARLYLYFEPLVKKLGQEFREELCDPELARKLLRAVFSAILQISSDTIQTIETAGSQVSSIPRRDNRYEVNEALFGSIVRFYNGKDVQLNPPHDVGKVRGGNHLLRFSQVRVQQFLPPKSKHFATTGEDAAFLNHGIIIETYENRHFRSTEPVAMIFQVISSTGAHPPVSIEIPQSLLAGQNCQDAGRAKLRATIYEAKGHFVILAQSNLTGSDGLPFKAQAKVVRIDFDAAAPEKFVIQAVPELSTTIDKKDTSVDRNFPLSYSLLSSADGFTLVQTVNNKLKLFYWDSRAKSYWHLSSLERVLPEGEVLAISSNGSRMVVSDQLREKRLSVDASDDEHFLHVLNRRGEILGKRKWKLSDVSRGWHVKREIVISEGSLGSDNIFIVTETSKRVHRDNYGAGGVYMGGTPFYVLEHRKAEQLHDDGRLTPANLPRNFVAVFKEFLEEHPEFASEWVKRVEPIAKAAELQWIDEDRDEAWVNIRLPDAYGGWGPSERRVLRLHEVKAWYEALAR